LWNAEAAAVERCRRLCHSEAKCSLREGVLPVVSSGVLCEKAYGLQRGTYGLILPIYHWCTTWANSNFLLISPMGHPKFAKHGPYSITPQVALPRPSSGPPLVVAARLVKHPLPLMYMQYVVLIRSRIELLQLTKELKRSVGHTIVIYRR
jgi:hypothetical protein